MTILISRVAADLIGQVIDVFGRMTDVISRMIDLIGKLQRRVKVYAGILLL